jgi:hypothetical protein
MDHLVRYYLHQAGRGIGSRGGIGPIYSVPLIYQSGYGIGTFLGGLWRMVRSFLWSGTKTLGRETLRTGGKILSDMADNSDGTPTGHIVSNHARDLISKLKGRGRKRKAANPKKPKRAAGRKLERTYWDIFA